MRRRDQHVVDRDAGELRGPRLGLVQQFARQHATIDDHNRDARRAVIEHKRAGKQRIDIAIRRALFEHAVDDHRESDVGVTSTANAPTRKLAFCGRRFRFARQRPNSAIAAKCSDDRKLS